MPIDSSGILCELQPVHIVQSAGKGSCTSGLKRRQAKPGTRYTIGLSAPPPGFLRLMSFQRLLK
jgi:hypothetical protein